MSILLNKIAVLDGVWNVCQKNMTNAVLRKIIAVYICLPYGLCCFEHKNAEHKSAEHKSAWKNIPMIASNAKADLK